MKSIKRNILVLLMVTFVVVLPLITLADDTVKICDPSGGKICNPIGQDSIKDFIIVILQGVLKIAIPVVVLALIYSGFLFVVARGNPEELSKAKSALLYTIIGTGVLLASIAIAELIARTVTSL
jgi:hypothetical protein